jgi:flagellar hook capping protein FlgD
LARVVSTLLVVGLLAGTAAAFAVTERLKLATSPISRVKVAQAADTRQKSFSPVCECSSDRALLAFRLAKRDHVTLAIVDSQGTPIRTLLNDRPLVGYHRFTWDGRNGDGEVVAQGKYRLRIQLSDLGRTFLAPALIQVDTTPPLLTGVRVRPLVFSPDGDQRADKILIRYRLSEPARVLLSINGKLRVRTKIRSDGGKLYWYGRIGGRSLRTGYYRLVLEARDEAGNMALPITVGRVRLRYIQIQGEEVDGVAGRRIRAFVSTDAKSYTWRVGSHSGVSRKRLLVIPPLGAGRHRLVVEERGHLDAVPVVVAKRR